MRIQGADRSGRVTVWGVGLAALGMALASCLGGCTGTAQRASDALNSPTGQQVLAVSCPLDQALQPVAVNLVGGLGAAGGTTAAIDKLLVHPFVLNLCKGGPVQIDPATVVAGSLAIVTLALTAAPAAQ